MTVASWRIARTASAPYGRSYVVVELLDAQGAVLGTEDVLMDVDLAPRREVDENGWLVRADGTSAPPWVLGDDGEWHPAEEDPENPWVWPGFTREDRVLEQVAELAPRWRGLTGDNTDAALAAGVEFDDGSALVGQGGGF